MMMVMMMINYEKPDVKFQRTHGKYVWSYCDVSHMAFIFSLYFLRACSSMHCSLG